MRVALFAILAGLAGCAALAPTGSKVWPKLPEERFAFVGGYLQVTGVGRADPKLGNATQRRSTSRDAGILDARARLSDYVQRLMVSGMSIGERATADAGWRRKLDQALGAMEIAETRWDDDDTAAVVVRAEKSAILNALDLTEGQ